MRSVYGSDGEVRSLLEYYDLSDAYDLVKEWYDGYRFGDMEIYCPWDVVCYCDKLCADRHARPQNFWSNTSGNDAVRHFIEIQITGRCPPTVQVVRL